MNIYKSKNLVLDTDKGIKMYFDENIKDEKGILVDFLFKNTDAESGLVINNPGEYEYNAVSIKVAQDYNMIIRVEGFKILMVCDIVSLIKQNSQFLADIVLFDNIYEKPLDQEQIVTVIKNLQPKIAIISSNLSINNMNTQKITKYKIKSNELTAITDTLTFII